MAVNLPHVWMSQTTNGKLNKKEGQLTRVGPKYDVSDKLPNISPSVAFHHKSKVRKTAKKIK